MVNETSEEPQPQRKDRGLLLPFIGATLLCGVLCIISLDTHDVSFRGPLWMIQLTIILLHSEQYRGIKHEFSSSRIRIWSRICFVISAFIMIFTYVNSDFWPLQQTLLFAIGLIAFTGFFYGRTFAR
jgi:hypothetical protein